MSPSLVERWLRADFPGHIRSENEARYAVYAQHVIKTAFPNWSPRLDFILLRSTRRACAQLPVGDGGAIVIDTGLISLMAVQDHLLRAPGYDIDDGLLVASPPFAEGLYHGALFGPAYLCASQCLARAPMLANLRSRAFGEPGHSQLGLFVLLHEIAHFAVDSRQPFALSAQEQVSNTIQTHRKHTLALAHSLTSGAANTAPMVSVETDNPSLLTQQLADHAKFVGEASDAAREATCDFLACVALLSMRAERDVLNEGAAALAEVPLRQIGDLLGLGLRASRLLMARGFFAQTIDNIVRGGDPSRFDLPFSHVTARHNALVNLLIGLFDGIVEEREGRRTETDGLPENGAELMQQFVHDVEVVLQRSTTRIFKPIETLGQYYLSPETYEADLAQLRAYRFGVKPVSNSDWLDALDGVLDAVPL